MPDEAQIRSDVPVRRYDYDGESLLVADLGAQARDAEVEVLDDVAIVIVPGPDGDRQFEFELPEAGVSHTFMRNGILTIEVNKA